MIRIAALDRPTDAEALLRTLRTTLDDAAFAVRLARAEAQGYRVLAAYEDETMVGVLGYRITDDLCWGRTFYVDDLVVAPDKRGAGIGARLLAEAKRMAKGTCDHLRLGSGLTRHDAHRFYETQGLRRFSVQFVDVLES